MSERRCPIELVCGCGTHCCDLPPSTPREDLADFDLGTPRVPVTAAATAGVAALAEDLAVLHESPPCIGLAGQRRTANLDTVEALLTLARHVGHFTAEVDAPTMRAFVGAFERATGRVVGGHPSDPMLRFTVTCADGAVSVEAAATRRATHRDDGKHRSPKGTR